MHCSIKKRLKALIPVLLLAAMMVVAITASPAMIFAAEHEADEVEAEEPVAEDSIYNLFSNFSSLSSISSSLLFLSNFSASACIMNNETGIPLFLASSFILIFMSELQSINLHTI